MNRLKLFSLMLFACAPLLAALYAFYQLWVKGDVPRATFWLVMAVAFLVMEIYGWVKRT